MNADTTTEIITSSEVSFQPGHRILSNKSMVHSEGQKTSSICSDEIPSPCARCVSAGQITSWDSTSLSDTIFRVSGVGSSRFVLYKCRNSSARSNWIHWGWAEQMA